MLENHCSNNRIGKEKNSISAECDEINERFNYVVAQHRSNPLHTDSSLPSFGQICNTGPVFDPSAWSQSDAFT